MNPEAPPVNVHGDHEANCLCCKKVTLGSGIDSDRWPYAVIYCDAQHFWKVPFNRWHDDLVRACHCPDFEARDD